MKQFDFLVGGTCTVIHRDRFDAFQITIFKDRTGFGETCGYGLLYHNAAVRGVLSVIGFASLMYTGDIMAMQVCKFQTDCDEQAWSVSTCVVQFEFRSILSTEGSKAQVVEFLLIHQTLCVRRGLLTTIQMFGIQCTSCGRKMMLTAMQLFTILHTLLGRRRLLLANLLNRPSYCIYIYIYILGGSSEARTMQISLQILKLPMERLQTQARECAGEGRDQQTQLIAEHQDRG